MACHTALWTLIPTLRNHNLPLDVIEHLAWGREWQFGYHKHPPMASWLLETIIAVFGRNDVAVYGLSQACIGIAFIAVWRIARSMLAPLPALFAVLFGEGILYLTFTSPEFNVNVASLPFWALAIAACHRLFVSNRDDQRKPTWVLLGLAMAGAVLAKYTAVLLGVCILILLLTRPAWHWWRKPGPYLAGGVFLLGVLPHGVWLALHGFPTFTYALARGDSGVATNLDHLLAPVEFLVSQLPAIAPALLLTALAWPWRPRLPRLRDRQDLFLLIMGLGPLLILMMIALIFAFDLKAMWGTTLFLLLGVMIVRWLAPAAIQTTMQTGMPSPQRLAGIQRLTAGVIAVALLGPLIYLAEPAVANGALKRAKRTQFPGTELARVLDSRWHAQFDMQLSIVIGDEWLAGIMSYYGTDRPSAFLNADSAESPWVTPEMMRQQGALVVWMADKRGSHPIPLSESVFARLKTTYPDLQEQRAITLPWAASGSLPAVHISWAIIPPQDKGELGKDEITQEKH